MPHYKFDASIYATFEVEAPNEEVARGVMRDTVDLLMPDRFALGGYNSDLPVGQAVRSIHLDIDSGEADLIDDDPDSDASWIRCAKEHGLEFVGYDGGSWRGRHDEEWVTDEWPTKAEVAREWCEYEGHTP